MKVSTTFGQPELRSWRLRQGVRVVVATFAITLAAAVGVWLGTSDKTGDGAAGPSTTVNVSDLQKSQRPAYYYVVNSAKQGAEVLSFQALAAAELAAIGEALSYDAFVINIGAPAGQLLLEAINAYRHAAWQRAKSSTYSSST
jgi:hypothetical protein